MRLDTALLLPGVIVIVSGIKPLQARALNGQESNASVRGSLRPDGAGSSGGEERGIVDRIAKLAEGCSGNSAVATKAIVSSLPKATGYQPGAARFSTSDYSGASKEAAMNLLHSDLDSLLNSWWATKHQIPKFESSPQHDQMSNLVRHVSELPSVKRTMSLEEVLKSRFTEGDLRLINQRPRTEHDENEMALRETMRVKAKQIKEQNKVPRIEG